MLRRAIIAPAISLLILAVTTALIAGILLTPRVWRMSIGAPGDAYGVSGAYPAEQGTGGSLRWTRASAELRLPGAYLGSAILLLRLYHEAQPAQDAPWQIAVAAPGVPPSRFSAAPGWRVYRLLLPPGASASALTLSSPTFQPGPHDPRDLGVAISELIVWPLPGAGTPLGVALLRALWLGIGASLAGVAAWLLDRWALGAAGSRGRPWRPAALVAGTGAALSVWAWYDPMSLAWMFSTNWSSLGAVALALAGLVGLTLFMGRRPSPLAPLPHGARGDSLEGATRKVSLRLSAIGYRPSAIGHRLSAIGYRLSAIGHRPSAIGYRLSAIGYRPSAIGYRLSAMILVHLVALTPALPADWRGLAAWVVLGVPGALLALAIFADERDPLERTLLAIAGALSVAAPLVLALHALPGPLEAWQLILAADGLSLLGLLAPSPPSPLSRLGNAGRGARAEARWLIPALLIAAGLRLPFLGAAEFQGDEAYVLMLARGIRYGQPDILFVHMKGPVEALLPAGSLVITGVVTEWIARLPFAVAGLAVILGAWVLVSRLIGGREGSVAGLVATCALAIDGFLIAFSRIVQYQSVIMLLSITAVWLCWRFYEGAERPRRYLLGAALCIGVALLAHYDGALSAPALAWLVIAGGRRRGWSARRWAVELAGPVALGLALTLSFYVPFVLHEHFVRTLDHLETRSGQSGAGPALYNSLRGYAELAGFYSFPAAFVSAGLALLSGLTCWLAIYVRPRMLGLALAALLAAGGLTAALAPQIFSIGADRSFAVLAVAPPILALALAPRLPAGMRALVIWFGAPFIAMAFFFADPRTHFYTMHLPAVLLAGLAVARLSESLRRVPWLRAALAAGGAALLLAALPYAYLIFLCQRPEYQRLYPDTRAAIYRPLVSDTLASDGYFGFPQRDGWKVVGSLFQRGELRGTVDSNQELFTSGWYMRGQFMCAAQPDYYIVSENVRPYYIPPGYQEYGAVTVSGERTLTIFSHAAVAGPPRSFDAAAYQSAYDQTPVPNFPLRRLLSGVVPQRSSDASWRAGFSLRGYDLDRSQLGPGDVAFLTFYWRAARPQPAGYVPVLQVRDTAGRVVTEATGICSRMPSDVWATNYVNDAPFRIRAADLPPGEYRLAVAMRDKAGTLLPLDDGTTARDLGAILFK